MYVIIRSAKRNYKGRLLASNVIQVHVYRFLVSINRSLSPSVPFPSVRVLRTAQIKLGMARINQLMVPTNRSALPRRSNIFK